MTTQIPTTAAVTANIPPAPANSTSDDLTLDTLTAKQSGGETVAAAGSWLEADGLLCGPGPACRETYESGHVDSSYTRLFNMARECVKTPATLEWIRKSPKRRSRDREYSPVFVMMLEMVAVLECGPSFREINELFNNHRSLAARSNPGAPETDDGN